MTWANMNRAPDPNKTRASIFSPLVSWFGFWCWVVFFILLRCYLVFLSCIMSSIKQVIKKQANKEKPIIIVICSAFIV